MSAVVYIYGLFDQRNRCRYVGVTGGVKSRMSAHKKSHPKWEFRLFRQCERERGTKIEGQVIRAFKRRGQADKNRHTGIVKAILENRLKRFRHPLQQLRKSRGIFATWTARQMGISASYLCFLETGRRPWNQTLTRLYMKAIGES